MRKRQLKIIQAGVPNVLHIPRKRLEARATCVPQCGALLGFEHDRHLVANRLLVTGSITIVGRRMLRPALNVSESSRSSASATGLNRGGVALKADSSFAEFAECSDLGEMDCKQEVYGYTAC
jgi:hypothetical protein